MKRFISNLLLFTLILFSINLLSYIFRDYSYGNKIYAAKLKLLKEKNSEFNTIVIGSSRLYRGIDPKVFDNLLLKYNLSMFNLAASATHHPEIYYLCERMINDKKLQFKYIFVEMGRVVKISEKNIEAQRNYYWHNLSYLKYALSYIHESHYMFLYQKKHIKAYIKSYVLSFVNNFIVPQGYKQFFVYGKKRSQDFKMGENKDGFYSLNKEASDSRKRGGKWRYLHERHMELVNNPELLRKRMEKAGKAFKQKNSDAFLNATHLKKCLHLINLAEKKGAHLIFIIPPRLGLSAYKELLVLKENLPQENVIELANPIKYPELYQHNYSFDISHMNTKGSKIFTVYLANEFKNIISE